MKRKHYLLIAALSLSLTTGACAATLTACGNDTELVQLTPSVTGTYYVEENGTEKTIELNVSTFMLNFGGGVLMGSYSSYEDGTITLLFDNGNTATAIFDNGKLTLSYDGKTYVMYLKTNYTVNFDVDGGSEVAAQSIVNGKKASRPDTNPTKADSKFIGWYTDNTYKTQFDFENTPITANTTVYARFIACDSKINVYTVTFDLGENATESFEPMETLNRVLYDLPTASAKDGKKFLGWWVSDYYDREKLSTKYEGQELYEDTVLYAVWEGGAPAVSVNAAGASWTFKGTNKTFDAVVKDEKGKVLKEQHSATTSIAYDFDEALEGNYTVEVTVDGQTATAYYKNKGLARATNLAVQDDYFTFDLDTKDPYLLVDYYLDLECGDDGHKHEHQHLNAAAFDFSNCPMKEGGIRFRVTAEAVGYVSSTSEWFTLERGLEKVTGLTVDEMSDVIMWDPVEHAKSYELELSAAGMDTVKAELTGTSFDMRLLKPASWTIKVTPLNYTYNTPETAEYTYNKQRLPSPSNFVITDTDITWDKVDGATGYRLYINGTAQTPDLDANTNTFAISEELFGETTTEYALTVIALGATGLETSLPNDPVYIHGKLQAPAYANGKVTWDAVVGMKRFGVKVGDAEEVFVENGKNVLEITFDKSGPVDITVTGYTSDGQVLDSATTTVEVHTITFDTLDGRKTRQYKADGDTITLPEAPERTGYDFTQWNASSLSGGSDKGYDAGTSFTFDAAMETGNIYAVWNARKYKISLVVGAGGAFEEETQTEYEVTFGERYFVEAIEGGATLKGLPVPVINADKEGDQEFAGWYTNSKGGTQVTDNVGYMTRGWNLAMNVTLYAQWGNSGVKYEKINDYEYMAMKSDNVSGLSTVTVLANYRGLPVTTLASNAFAQCPAITTLRLPSSLKKVIITTSGPTANGSAFYAMTGLQNVEVYEVEDEDRYYQSVDGCLYSVVNDEIDTLLFVPSGKNVPGTFKVADGTKTIGSRAASSFSEVTEVVIPASVTKIEDNVFDSMYNLEKVTFLPTPNGEMGANLTIGSAFKYFKKITSVTFPKRLVKIAPDAFSTSYDRTLMNFYVQELGDTTDRKTNYYDIDGVLCKSDELVMFPAARSGAYQTPSGISVIGEGAFKGNKTITSVRFIATVTKIGIEAFSGCSALQTISFDDRAGFDLEICEKAFYGCAFESIELPVNLQKLGKYAFGGMSGLSSVTVNSNRKNLEYANDAFGNTSSKSYVSDLYIGENMSVVSISGVFGSALRNIEIDPKNPYYHMSEGVVYDKAITRILFFPNDKSEFVIDDNLKTISAGTFSGKDYLSSITIGTGVTRIEDGAFSGCTGLTTVIFKAGGTEELTIGKKAFYGCNAISTLTFNGRSGAAIMIDDEAFALSSFNGILEEITLPEGVKSLGKFAFDGRNTLTTINLPSTLESIAFFEKDDEFIKGSSSSKLTSISVPNVSAFRGCGQLQSINVAEGNNRFASIGGVLFGKENVGSNDAPQYEITTLYYAPWKCQGMAMPAQYRDPEGGEEQFGYLEIPETVTKVSDYAFYYNFYIKRVSFDGIRSEFTFGNNIFYLSKLEAINLPKGTSALPDNIFASCSELKSVTIPNTVATIGVGAFRDCKMLSEVIFEEGNDELGLTLADGTSTGGQSSSNYGSFSSCSKLTSIELPARTKYIGKYAFASSGLNEIRIPANVETIFDYAFQSCSSLSNVTFGNTNVSAQSGGEEDETSVSNSLPDMVIGASAFASCPLWKAETSFALPVNIVELGTSALSGTGLTTLTIPARLTTLKKLNITTLEELKFATMEVDGKQVNMLETFETSIFENMKNLTSVELEKCTKIKEIPEKAFKTTGLTSIKIPVQVQTIGISAFEGSVDLTSLTFLTDENGKSCVKTIGNSAFKNTGLTEFIFPTLESGELSLGSGLFEGCADLTDMTISASVQNIGSALSKAPNLQNIDVDEGSSVLIDATNRFILTKLDGANNEYAILSVFSVPNVDASGKCVLPSTFNGGSITEIGEGAFAGQNAVKKIVIPDTIQKIGTKAFSQCRGLETVEFAGKPSVNYFGDYAFEQTNSLDTLVIPNSVKTIGQNCFYFSGIREVTMPDELTSVAKQIFYGSMSLHTVNNLSKMTLGTAATNSGESMFERCRSLRHVTFAEGADTLPAMVFADCPSLEEIDLTGILTFGVKANGEDAKIFGSSISPCVGLKVVVFDGNLQVLPAGCFVGCSSLTTVYRSDLLAEDEGKAEEDTYRFKNKGIIDLSQITTIGKVTSSNAFASCSSIKVVDIRNMTKYLATSSTGLFSGCTALNKIILSSSLTLPQYMFNGCSALKTVQYWDGNEVMGTENEVTLAPGLTTINNYAFQNSGIEKVIISKSMTKLGTATAGYCFSGCKQLKEVILPSGLTLIGGTMFKDCVNLTTIKYRTADGTDVGNDNEITLPASLTELGTYCFQNCTGLTEIDLVNINNLGNYSFQGCTGLTGIDLSKITTLGTYCFKDCTSLTDVTLPSNITSLSNYCFQNCTSLTEIDLLNITTLGNSCFQGCTSLTEIDLSKITTLGSSCFLGCTSLTEVDLSKATTLSSSCFQDCTALQTINIPNATKLDASCFKNCTSLQTIDIPKVIELGNYCFQGCTSLTGIDISNVTKIGTSGGSTSGMFWGCESLASVKMNDDITVLGSGMFAYCKALTGELDKDGNETLHLPADLKATNTYTFYNSGLKTITLPSGVVYLGATSATATSVAVGTSSYVFSGCTDLQTVTVSENFAAMGGNVFLNCASLEAFIINGTNTKFVQIGNAAFKGCTNLKTIDLSQITAFGTTPFSGCVSLTAVNLSAATDGILKANMFENCTSLTSVTLGEAITTLQNYMFKGCTALESIDLSNVTNIGNYTFQDCTALNTVILNGDLTTLGNYVFSGCSSLNTVYRSDTAEANRVEGVADFSGITSFGSRTFTYCDELTEVVLSDDLTVLSDTLFGWSGLEKINMPSSLMEMKGQVFLGCSSLAKLELPASLTTLGTNLFNGCSSLELSIAAGNDTFAINENGWLVNTKENRVLFIPPFTFGNGGEPSDVTEVNFAEGAQLNAYMFSGYSSVNKITLPSDMTEIANYAFWNFKGHFGADFAIPAGVTSIGAGAFQNCANLTEIVIPEGVTSIGNNAFQNCGSLVKVTLPSTIRNIGDYAFDGCPLLAELVLPATVPEGNENDTGLSIGASAFKGCTEITGVLTLPDGIVSVGANAFEGCTGITGIVFGKHLVSIGASAFKGCAGITSVTFDSWTAWDNSITTSLGANAFDGCAALTNVEFSGTGPKTIGANAFAGCDLTTVRLGAGLTAIPAAMFEGNEKIESINIPYTVTSIGATAFYGCTNLSAVTFEETPAGADPVGLTIAAGASSNAPNDTYLFIDKFGVGYKGVFVGCTSLASIELPSRLSSIGSFAFAGSKLTTITIPAGTTGVGAFIFSDLTTVSIGYKVTKLDKDTFGGCEELVSVEFDDLPEGEEAYGLELVKGSYSASLSSNGGQSYFNEANGNYYSGVFAGCTKLSKAKLPSSGSLTLGDYSFYYCTELSDLVVSNEIVSIGTSCFSYCTSIAEIVIPVTAKVDNYVFEGWTGEQQIFLNVKGAEIYSVTTATNAWGWYTMQNSKARVHMTGMNYVDEVPETPSEEQEL